VTPPTLPVAFPPLLPGGHALQDSGSHTTPRRRRDALLAWLTAPVDGASLAALRIAFGLIAMWEVYRYFTKGWIGRYWIEPEFHFTYHGFGWVEPLPGDAMYVLWAALGLAALCIALGLFYRPACWFFALGFGYSFLLESARYLNHFYLITLLAVLLAIVPAHRVWSLDARRKPALRSDTVPTWALWLLRFQVGVVYVFGGIAKLNADWLRGEPISTWLADESHLAVIGPALGEPWVGLAAAWGSLAFDLLIVFAVLWRPTRIPALVVAATFHFINNELFSIGVFAYLAFAALLLFCDPGWPRTAVRWLTRRPQAVPAIVSHDGPRTSWRRVTTPLALGLAGVYVFVQLALPLRHMLYPGIPNWNEHGHTFSWHMKLRSKQGELMFTAVDPATGQRFEIDPTETLMSWQYNKMTIRPEMIREFAHHIADEFAERGQPDVRVYAITIAALNGRDPQPLVDPRIDLAKESRTLAAAPWIVPLRGEIPRKRTE
jgi:vitamin K-dependent gamma-carboxylase